MVGFAGLASRMHVQGNAACVLVAAVERSTEICIAFCAVQGGCKDAAS